VLIILSIVKNEIIWKHWSGRKEMPLGSRLACHVIAAFYMSLTYPEYRDD